MMKRSEMMKITVTAYTDRKLCDSKFMWRFYKMVVTYSLGQEACHFFISLFPVCLLYTIQSSCVVGYVLF